MQEDVQMAAIAPSVFENNPPKAFPFKRLLDFKIQQKSKTNKNVRKMTELIITLTQDYQFST